MTNSNNHVEILDKKITELSDALARLGKGKDLKELIRIIRRPGWTSVAEFALTAALLDSMQHYANGLNSLTPQLLAAGKLVASKRE